MQNYLHNSQKNINFAAIMKEIIDFIRSCPTYFIATVDGDNQPRVRPFSSICEFEGRLYIESRYSKPFAHQVAANPLVEISAFDGVSRWIRISARLVDDPRVVAKAAMLTAMPELRDLGFDEHDEDMAVYYLADAVAVFSSYTDAPRTIHLAC